MSERDEVQVLVDEFCKSRGYSKRSGSWYRRQDETIAVVNLQRSQHSHAYYLNVALWLIALGDAAAPKEHTCHVRTRADRLVDDGELLGRALDLERNEVERGTVIVGALALVDDLLTACSSLVGCRETPGRRLIERSLVRGPAHPLVMSDG